MAPQPISAPSDTEIHDAVDTRAATPSLREHAETSRTLSRPSPTLEITLSETASENRGPRMARYGFLIVALIASLGIATNLLVHTPYRAVNLLFYGVELPLALTLTAVSFTQWYKSHWEAIVLSAAIFLLAGMAAASVAADNFRAPVLGLLLLQMGAAAFLPWRPRHQFCFNAGTLACVAVFTLFTAHFTVELLGYWIVLFAGSIIGQVACVSSYRYRAELGRRLDSLISGRERLAVEVRERERVIATLRETQQELMVSREAALAASRARSEFLSSMSHEIRTPMNSVLGMAELLGETELNAEQHRYLDLIQSNGETLLELINSILDLARMESGRLSLASGEFDLRDLLEQLLDALAVAAFEKRLELVGRFDAAVPRRVVGDSFRLRQILTNLIGNAIKFTERGQVVVKVAPDLDSNLPGAIRFTVADTGIGIAPDKLKMIFEPFTQADSSSARGYGGSGLGLAIAARLVGMMHGELSADSEPGRGSTFTFTVPFERPATGIEEHLPSLWLAGASALVVDDNEEVRRSLSEMLTLLGARTEECTSGGEAFQLLEKIADRKYAVVLMGSCLPDLTLTELIARLSASAVDFSRIVMMLRTTDLTRDLATMRSAGLNWYVTKPVKFAELAAACSAVAGVLQAPTPPIHRPAPAQLSAQTEISMPARLLIADDVAVNRTLIHDMLKPMPFEIDDAVDGHDALSKVMTRNYDLVLMDMQMPVLDGYDAAAAIRRWEREQGRKRMPIVALTASALEADIKRAVEAGCDLHLAKPFRRKELVKLLGEQLAGARSQA